MNRKYFLFIILAVSCIYSTAQSQLDDEMEKLSATIVQQLNNYGHIKTIAVDDFTDLSYTSNKLGRHLTEELIISLVMSPNKNFTVVSRNQLKRLLEEVKLDGKGMLAPENVAKLGRLKGVNLVIGGVMTPTYNDVRINISGIELETGSLLIANKPQITLTPSLRKLMDKEQDKLPTPESDLEETDISSQALNHPSYIKGSLNAEVRTCKVENGSLVCNFQLLSKGTDHPFSVYADKSDIILSSNKSLRIVPAEIVIDNKRGSRRVSKTLYADEKVSMKLTAHEISLIESVSQINIQCFSNLEGAFTMTFNNISVTP